MGKKGQTRNEDRDKGFQLSYAYDEVITTVPSTAHKSLKKSSDMIAVF